MEFMLQYFLSIDALVTAIISLALGIIVFTKDRKNIVNLTLFILNSDVALWLFGYWRWMSIYDNADQALFWSRILTIGSTLIPVLFLHWSLALLGLNKQKKWVLVGSYLISAVFIYFSFSPLMVRSVEPHLYFTFWPKAGFLYAFYLAFCFVGIFFTAIYYLFSEYRHSVGLRRNQIKYVLAGILCAIIGGVTNFPLWYDVQVLPVGNVLIVGFSILISLAVIKHRLMDLKFVLRQSTVYILSIATVAGAAALARFIFIRFVGGFLGWADLVLLVLAILVFSPVRVRYYRLANRYFFSSLYDSRQLISELSEKMRSTLDLDKIYSEIGNSLMRAFRLKAIGILAATESGHYLVKYNRNFPSNQQIFPGDQELNKQFTIRSQPMIVEELREAVKSSPSKSYRQLVENLYQLGVAMLIPLNLKGETLGMLALGAKESNDMYNDEDLKTLEIIASQLAIAVKNAMLYRESLEFNVKLASEEKKISAILANLPDPVLFVDKFNRLSLMNDAAKEVLGLHDHDLGANLVVDSNFSINSFKGIIGKEFSVKSGKELNLETNEEELTTDFDGEQVIYKIVTAKVSDDIGQFLGTLKIFYNLTREKRIDRMKSEFITIAAHQLRTPLSGVKWALGMLREGDLGQLNEDQKQVVDESFESNERMIVLVNDLLDVSRIEEGRYEYKLEPARVEELVESAIKACEGLIQRRNIKFQYVNPGRLLPMVMVDKEKIMIAAQNLLENAAKYTLPGGQVTLSLKDDINEITLSVKDTGVGVPKNQQERLFSKFFRGSNVMKMETDGSGFGLFITRNIIQAHGGRIWAESEEGKGSTFSFAIPIKSLS